ncbi:hypothetical protein FJT64_018757 [Amphibalanus amphitrite]|uniref:DUF7041 domain-containing protein n=1 Tax=Amphibalanus amphitrite TaxID=1232801 RepID=A0A6A4WY13_AMPAM|nr:hypothetical protein FJT64_018757 [Amphibalanus amphitrite]
MTPALASAASRPVASLRLPPFSTEETELWLSQVECALGVAGITDDLTRYQVLVVNLPTEVAVQVRDVISSPAPSYATLTAALRERLAQSRASRLEALLRHQQLGDHRPSELLRRMQGELAMAGVLPADNGLLRTLYKQRLPQSARAALSLLPEDIPLPELAAAADRFMEANTPALSVSAVHQAPQPPNQSALDQLTASVAALTAAIGQMQTDLTSLRQGNYGQQDQQRRYRAHISHSFSRTLKGKGIEGAANMSYMWLFAKMQQVSPIPGLGECFGNFSRTLKGKGIEGAANMSYMWLFAKMQQVSSIPGLGECFGKLCILAMSTECIIHLDLSHLNLAVAGSDDDADG